MSWNSVREGSVTKEYVVSWNSSEDETNGVGVTNNSYYSARNLQSNTAYNFKITARNVAGLGEPSDQFPVLTGTGIISVSWLWNVCHETVY